MKPAKRKAAPTHLQVEVVRAFWIADREAKPGDILTFPRGFAGELIAWGKAKPYHAPAMAPAAGKAVQRAQKDTTKGLL